MVEGQPMVRAGPGDGITAQARGAGRMELRAGHGYRNATLESAPARGPDGARRRPRVVRLERRDDARTAVLPPRALDAGDVRVNPEWN